MANIYQEEKRKQRLDSIVIRRERRRDPELRKNAPGGLGTKRNKIPLQGVPNIKQQRKQNTSTLSPALPTQATLTPLSKPPCDKIEISEEAYQRYRDKLLAN
ncbi:MAG: hypothetical protein KKH94_01565 [Candidatus Omnitrophica bacterium]|nr:hypothetical protein [Candidatus Omnitrophota bacterium]